MSTLESTDSALVLTAEIAKAYVANNPVQLGQVGDLIREIHKGLTSLAEDEPVIAERPQPAISIRKSVQRDHIVCLEDGAKLKMLKRYIATRYDMTPEQYRERWGLPADYPMVAPDYAERRSVLAKSIGLGRKRAPEAAPTKKSAKGAGKAASKPRPVAVAPTPEPEEAPAAA